MQKRHTARKEDEDLMNPTPQQAEAAETPTSVAVTAGAGTGKTRMLAWRYMHHIEADKLTPLQIVAVTFTDKMCIRDSYTTLPGIY